MRKLWLNIVIVASMLLAACSQAATPANQPENNPTAANSGGKTGPSTQIATEDPSVAKMACRIVSSNPTPGPTEASMFPPVSTSDWTIGKGNKATLTLIEYSDFQCPYCAQLAPIVEEFQKKHPDEVQVVFRYFPLPSHPLSIPAAEAAEAAGMQGKFWQMHDALFSNQNTWAGMTADQFNTWLDQQAQTVGLDKAKFDQDRTSKAVTDKIQAAQKHGVEIGIPGTPLVLLNGQYYQGPRDLQSFESVLGLYALKDRQFTYCPPMIIDTKKQYTATLKTNKGDIILQLFPDKAPMAVNSFVFLTKQGWFNNVPFHRVLTNFVAQSGDPSGSGFGGPGYSFDNETSDLKFDKEGMVGMANSGPGTNGSQFFITFAPSPNLDGQYTVFAQVIQGMDVAKKLTARDPSQGGDLPQPDKIISVEIKEK